MNVLDDVSDDEMPNYERKTPILPNVDNVIEEASHMEKDADIFRVIQDSMGEWG